MPRCGVPFNSSMVSDKVVPQTNQTKGLTKGGDFARSASRRSLVCFTIIAFGRIAGLVNRHNSNRGLACANGFPAYEVCNLIISTLMGGGGILLLGRFMGFEPRVAQSRLKRCDGEQAFR